MAIDFHPTDRAAHAAALRLLPAASAPDLDRAVAAVLAELGAPDVLARRWVRGPAGAATLVLVAAPAAPAPHAGGGLPAPDDAEAERRGRALGLTRREAQVAARLARRRTNDEIARDLGISPHTARHHTERVLEKLHLTRRTDVAAVLAPAAA